MRRGKRPATLKREVDEWNAANPIGTPVRVRLDDGRTIETRTRSEAWVLCGNASVLVDGIRGGYLLERMRPMTNPPISERPAP